MTTDTPSVHSSAPQFNDFFALFAQPEQFDIDLPALERQYLALQKQYHPDQSMTAVKGDPNKAKSESRTPASAEASSALINHAYQILKSPDSRATYLLERQQQADTLNHSISDLDFLDDAMTLRMSLDEAIEDSDLPTLQELKPQISERLNDQSQRFDLAYRHQQWSEASDATQKLKFLVKLNADVLAGIDTVSNQGDLDDDLYV